jgi:hypothetical protein
MFPLGYQPQAGQDGGAQVALEARNGSGAAQPELAQEKLALRPRVGPYGETTELAERR